MVKEGSWIQPLGKGGLKPRKVENPCSKAWGSKLFRAVTPKIINPELKTPLYLFQSIPHRNDVKIADLKAHNASHRTQFGLFSIKKGLESPQIVTL